MFLQDIELVASFNEGLLSDTDRYEDYLVMIVCGCSLFLFLISSLIVLIFTNRITRPIRKLTDKTEQLKKAVDTDSKNHVVDSLEKEDIFKSVNQSSSTKFKEIDEIEELKKLFCEFVMFKDDVKNFKYYAPRYYEKASHSTNRLKLSYQPPELAS